MDIRSALIHESKGQVTYSDAGGGSAGQQHLAGGQGGRPNSKAS